MSKAIDAKYLEMTQTPVRRLVLRLAGPTIISMIVTALYNVADAAFVGHLSTEATAGIGVGFAYMTFIQAIGFFFGHGSGNHMSHTLGARHYAEAAVTASVGFFTPFFLGIVVAVGGLCFLTPLSLALGATPEVVPQCNAYLRYILLASPFMMSALTLNNQLRLQGNARIGMVGLVSGAVLNIALDPLFIYVFDMGVTGASLATAVSQIFSWALLLWGTMRPESVHISLRHFLPSWRIYREIVMGGLPSLCRQAFNCLSVVLLNHVAVNYASAESGASAIAAFAVVSRTMMFAFAIVLGFCQGGQPVSAFNFGAQKYGRVLQGYRFSLIVTTILLTIMASLGYLFAPQIIAIFRDQDPTLICIGTEALRWQCLSFPLISVPTVTNMLFQNIRMPFRSTFISIGRQGLFFIPSIFILPNYLGLQGVEMTQAVADLLTFLMSIPFAIWIYRKLKRMSSETSE